MMKTNIFRKGSWLLCAILLAAPLTLTTSCSDELDALPGQSKVDGNVVVDQKSAIVALNGVYYTFAMCGTDNYDVKSTGCSQFYEIFTADLAGTAVYYQGPYLFEPHDPMTLSRYCGYFWTPFYATVNAANAFIKQMEGADDSWFEAGKKNALLGEAYAMRALAHYNLLRLFGYSWDINSPYGCIVRTEQSTTLTLPKGRSSVKDTYDQILSDLDFAIANAPVANDNYYVSQWFAKGLKARVLMMRGQDGDYAQAAQLCADVIQNGPYALEENYEDIFHQKGLASQEVIFGIQPKENQTDVKEAYYYRNSPQYFPTDNMVALYEGDPRLQQMYKLEQAEQYGYNEDGTLMVYYIDQYTICKHLNPATFAADETEETQYQMRLSEMYLLRAEALARTGNIKEAATLLKTVMSKSGITDFTAVDAATTQEAMLRQIFNEALKNLSFECGLEHDIMLRFPESITLQFNPVYGNKQYNILPFPTDEFKYNFELTENDQNPGYSIE